MLTDALRILVNNLFKASFYEKRKKTIRGCLVHVFKQPFLIFEQHYMYFHTFLPTHIFIHVFKQQFLVFKYMYQIPLNILTVFFIYHKSYVKTFLK